MKINNLTLLALLSLANTQICSADIEREEPLSSSQVAYDNFKSGVSTIKAGVSGIVSSITSIPMHLLRSIRSSFSIQEREELSQQSELLAQDYEANYNSTIAKISREQLFGRTLSKEELSFLTNIADRIELAQANLFNLNKVLESRARTESAGFTESEQAEYERYLKEKQMYEQDFFLKELDTRYEARGEDSYAQRKKEYEIISSKLLVNLMNYQSALRKEMLSLKGSEKRIQELQGIVNNITFEFHYLRIKNKIEKQIYDAHNKIYREFFVAQEVRDQRFNEQYQKIIAAGRQELLSFEPMIRDVREPFSHSSRRTRKKLVTLKEAEEIAHIEEIQGDTPGS